VLEEEEGPTGGAPGMCLQFGAVETLVLKGLLSPVTHEAAIEVLSRISTPACDAIFGDAHGTRLLLHCMGLLPWMGVVLHASSEANLGAAFVVSSASSSAIQQELAQARAVGMKVAKWCVQRDLQALADALFLRQRGFLLWMTFLRLWRNPSARSGSPTTRSWPWATSWRCGKGPRAVPPDCAPAPAGPAAPDDVTVRTRPLCCTPPALPAAPGQWAHGREQALGVLEAILNCCTPLSTAKGARVPQGACGAGAG